MNDNKYNFAGGGFNDIDASNTVNGKPIYYWVNKQNMTVPADAGYVALINCTNITVQGLTLTHNGHGVLLKSTTNTRIVGNTITNNQYGLEASTSKYNNISANTITNNNYYGIYFYESSNNSISANNITNNNEGIYLDSSSSNHIYHNNFVGNTTQARVAPGDVNNIWDDGYPSGGNYWSTYSGVDFYSGPYQNETGSDGIGDSNYTINAVNNDRYPLMGPFSTFNCGAWDSKLYYADIVSNSTISAFNFNPTQKLISFNVNGSAGTMGFCKITIDNALLSGPYTVWVDATPVTPSVTSNGTHSTLYFTYAHSTHNVTIIGTLVIPDSHSSLGLLMVMLVAMSALLYMKKKRLASRSN
jgi:parallel beta-helix repeat protein